MDKNLYFLYPSFLQAESEHEVPACLPCTPILQRGTVFCKPNPDV